MKLMKRLHEYIKGREGFTLMELIVVVVIIGIIGAGLVGLLVPSINVYTNSMSLSQGKLIAQGLCDQIASELTYANGDTVAITGGGTSVSYTNYKYGTTTIAARNDESGSYGVAVTIGSDTDIGYDSKYYMNKQAAVAFEWGDEAHDVMLVTVTVSENGDTLNSFTRPIRLINKADKTSGAASEALEYLIDNWRGAINIATSVNNDCMDSNGLLSSVTQINTGLSAELGLAPGTFCWRIVRTSGNEYTLYWADVPVTASNNGQRIAVTQIVCTDRGNKTEYSSPQAGTATVARRLLLGYYYIDSDTFTPN